jgi:hypothetical protein
MKKIFSSLLVLSLIICISGAYPIEAAEPSERFLGYNKQRSKWVTGNLGKAYVEGDYVSYQLRIDKSSKIWGLLEFDISYNFFQPSSGAVYIDGFDTSADTGFQYSTGDFLPDGQPIPGVGWGIHIPTPEAGEPYSSGPKIDNYMDDWPPGTGDGTPSGSSPSKERYFTVSGIPWGDATTHIIIFFRARLALNVVWSVGAEANLPTELDGDEFETWTNAWNGASYASGSSRHFYLQVEGVGAKTIPIPTKIREFLDLTVSKTVTYTRCGSLVMGTITIDNPNPSDVMIHVTILDEVLDNGVLMGSQDLTPGGPILLPSGISTYDYRVTISGDSTKTYINRVTVEVFEYGLTYQAEVPVTFPIG